MLLLFVAKLFFHAFVFAITISFITFSLVTKIRKKYLLRIVQCVFVLLIATDADRPRIEYRRGIVDSTFDIGTGPKYLERNFQITGAFCDIKNMEHRGIRRLLLILSGVVEK